MRTLLLLAEMTCFGQSVTMPTRHFHDLEVLKVDGAEVTIRMPKAQCAEIDKLGYIVDHGDVCVSPLGMFLIHVTTKDADHVEIVVGKETHFEGLKDTILQFETFSSPVQVGIDTAVGSFSELDKIRTIRIRLMKVKAEEFFR